MYESYMQRALELAQLGWGRTNPNPLVGAVIVKNGRIIAEGYHKRLGGAHAEVAAFLNAKEDVAGGTLYAIWNLVLIMEELLPVQRQL